MKKKKGGASAHQFLQDSQHLRVSGGVLRTNYCNGRSSPAPQVTVAPSCVHRSSSCGVHRIALAVIAAPVPVEGVYRTTIALAPVVVSQPWPPSCLRSPPLRRSIRWAALAPTTTLTTLALTTPATTGGISRYIVEYNVPAPWCLTPRLRRLWSLWSLAWRSPPSRDALRFASPLACSRTPHQDRQSSRQIRKTCSVAFWGFLSLS